MSRFSRRDFLRFTAGVSGVALLSACAPAASPQAGDAAGEATTEGVEVTFWWWDDAGNIWAEGYKDVKPEVKINFVNTPFADAHDKLLTSFAAGSGAPDVASIEIGRVGGFTAKGGLIDLKEVFDAGKYEQDMVAYKWTQGSTEDGRLVCMPWDIGPAGVWYRADILDELGLPSEPADVEAEFGGADHTWDDFFAFAQKVKDASNGETSLFADAGTDIYGASYRQQGEGYQEGNKVLIIEKATRPFQLAAQARNGELDANIPWWGPEWAAGVKDNAFAGMVIAAWMQGGLTRDQPQTVGNWRLVHAPEANYNWGGSFTAIPEQSAVRDEAWAFVEWACCTADAQNLLFKQTGVFPAYKPAWQDPLYDEPVEFFGGQAAYRVWTEIADNIPAIFRTPNDLQLDDIVSAELTKVLKEGKDPEVAAADAEAEALNRIPDTTG
ncbi:MAG: substrate-binding domain-containing protein [Caldilineaceae bacterium]